MASLRGLPEGLEHLRKRSTVLSLWRNDLEVESKTVLLRKEVLGKLAIHLEMKGIYYSTLNLTNTKKLKKIFLKKGLKEEGLFRISGSAKDTEALYQSL